MGIFGKEGTHVHIHHPCLLVQFNIQGSLQNPILTLEIVTLEKFDSDPGCFDGRIHFGMELPA